MSAPDNNSTDVATLQNQLSTLKDSLEMAELMLREQAEELSETNQELRDKSDQLMELRRQSLDSETRERVAIADADASELVRGIVETVPDAIITIDAAGIISMINPAAEDIFGYSEQELQGRNVSELMPEPFSSEHDGYLERYHQTGEARIIGIGREVVAKRRDGSEFPVELSVGRFHTGEEQMFAGVIRDITQRKAAQEKLAQTQQQLSQAEKMASLGGLVAGVAHEINTPVGIGITAASSLQDKVEQLSGELQSGQMKRSSLSDFLAASEDTAGLILKNLDKAAHLVQSFKQLAVVGTGGDRREFTIDGPILEALSLKRSALDAHNIRVDIDCTDNIPMHSYPADLRQVLEELFDNALLHAFKSAPEGVINITSAAGEQGVVITVHDNGCGLPEGSADKVFEPFYTTLRGQGGVGLGLHVVFNLVAASLGGNIAAQSDSKGTTFVIDLPQTHEQAATDASYG